MRKIELYDALVILFTIYLFSTFFYKLIPTLNSILGILFILIVICIYFKNLKKKDIFIIFPITYYVLISIIKGDDINYFLEHTIHLISTILFIWKLTSPDITQKIYTSLIKYKRLISSSIVLIAAINIILLIGNSHNIINTGTTVFSGLSNGSHTIASISCFAIIMSIVLNKNTKMAKTSLLSIVAYILIIIASGSRIYLIVLLAIFYCLYREKIKLIKHYRLYTIIIILVVALFTFNSSMFDRIVSTANNRYISSNKLEAFSSGRLIWWKYDLREYGEMSLSNKIFGSGNHIVFEINKHYYGMSIWAHNDFIQILLSYGIVGLLFYMLSLLKAYNNIIDKKNKIYSLIIFLTIICIAAINGFYTQQHMVFCILLMSILQNIKKNDDKAIIKNK